MITCSARVRVTGRESLVQPGETPVDRELAGHRTVGELHGLYWPGRSVNMQLVGHLFLAAGGGLIIISDVTASTRFTSCYRAGR